jgi:uncharacterized CHY-type Zn-finger protein
MYLVTILSFFSILETQCMVEEALLYAGRKTAVESSTIDSDEALFLSAEAFLVYVLYDNTLVENHIKHGVLGINLLNSKFDGEEIVLRAEYTVVLPISFFGLDGFEISSEYSFRKWIGDKQEEITDGSMVYVTTYGEVYHTDLSCRSLQLSIKRTTIDKISSLRGENGQKYYECNGCDWNESNKERVYYTDYGTLYHKDITCSKIKRTIQKIEFEEIGNRRLCSYCSES